MRKKTVIVGLLLQTSACLQHEHCSINKRAVVSSDCFIAVLFQLSKQYNGRSLG